MPLRTSISGTIISIIIGILITLGLSQNSIDFYGVPLLVICFVYSYIIHWIFFVHGYLFQTEHYFDAIGSFTFVSLSFFLIFTVVMLLFLTKFFNPLSIHNNLFKAQQQYFSNII